MRAELFRIRFTLARSNHVFLPQLPLSEIQFQAIERELSGHSINTKR